MCGNCKMHTSSGMTHVQVHHFRNILVFSAISLWHCSWRDGQANRNEYYRRHGIHHSHQYSKLTGHWEREDRQRRRTIPSIQDVKILNVTYSKREAKKGKKIQPIWVQSCNHHFSHTDGCPCVGTWLEHDDPYVTN